MKSYRGSLKIASTQDVVDAEFDVSDESLAVTTGGESLGAWPLLDLDPEDFGAEVRVSLDGEVVTIKVANHSAFVADLAPHKRKGRRRGRREQSHPAHSRKEPTRPARKRPDPSPKQPQRPQRDRSQDVRRESAPREPRDVMGTARQLFDPETWRAFLGSLVVRWVLAFSVVAALAGLVIFATASVGMILVLFGMVALVIAALAVSEDLSAYSWIPGDLSEITVLIVGVAAMVVGGVMMVVG